MNTNYRLVISRYDNNIYGKWTFSIPNGEASGIEPAHIHIYNSQNENETYKIWIGINENYARGERGRYVFAFDGDEPREKTKQTLFKLLGNAFASDYKGIVSFYEDEWQAGWYTDF